MGMKNIFFRKISSIKIKIIYLFIFLLLFPSHYSTAKDFVFKNYKSNPNDTLPLAVLGDTQPTLLIERIIGRESNLKESETIINYIS